MQTGGNVKAWLNGPTLRSEEGSSAFQKPGVYKLVRVAKDGFIRITFSALDPVRKVVVAYFKSRSNQV